MDTDALAYIAGVIKGDGYVDHGNVNPRLSLDVTSQSFAEKFRNALEKIGLQPRTTERTRYHAGDHPRFKNYKYVTHYHKIRATCSDQVISLVKNFEPRTVTEKIEFLKGFFDSEKYYNRKLHQLAIRNTNRDLLRKIQRLLGSLGVQMNFYDYPNQSGASLRIGNWVAIDSLKSLGLLEAV